MTVLDSNDMLVAEHLKDVSPHDLALFMLRYKSAAEEVMTKIRILRDEYEHLHQENPIEHLSSRVKSPISLLDKVRRKGCALTLEAISSTIFDIAGVRVTCAFVSDVYRVRDAVAAQSDLEIVSERDYISQPKRNGYRSLHLIVTVPVFFSDHTERVPVEIQLRTIAMDFWASLEHKIYYKYDHSIPDHLLDELRDAATTATALDQQMERLHRQIRGAAASATAGSATAAPAATDPATTASTN